ncbi:retrovirus-related pol polyprotein from transposon TNT 1-94 [Tanacetum coccineum]
MQGASCTQRKVSMVPFVFSIPFVLSWGGSISSDSFLPSIMLLVAKYALEIHKNHGMDKRDSFGTPLATKLKLDANLNGKPIDQTNYRSMIGSLMYLTSSRPDLVQADSGFELTAFSDADHVGCIDPRKSTSRGIQFLDDKLVSWMSKKQDCTAMSSAEAEYVALSASFIAISCNPVQHSRTKHIHTRYHFIKEQVKRGIFELYFVRTEYQLADMFTKALSKDSSVILPEHSECDSFCITRESNKILPETSSNKLCGRGSYALSWKPCQGDSSKLNLPDHSLIPGKSDSLPHAHTQATMTYYKHQDSRIKKAQELNTKTSANSDIQDLP